MSPKTNVHVGDWVEILLSSDRTKTSSGIVWRIFPPSDKYKDWDTVLLKNGSKGHVIRVMDSEEDTIKQRIMSEDQHTENKEKFSEDVMRYKVIPLTVQSFLNSEGGHLYIGVRDTGTLEERLVGLDYDLRQIDGYGSKEDDKLYDELERKIMGTLDKHLESDTALGPLVSIKFVQVSGRTIADINIKQSPKPWFFRYLTRNNKLQKFALQPNYGKKIECELDFFYIRQGSSKKMLPTHKEVYKYIMDHFKT